MVVSVSNLEQVFDAELLDDLHEHHVLLLLLEGQVQAVGAHPQVDEDVDRVAHALALPLHAVVVDGPLQPTRAGDGEDAKRSSETRTHLTEAQWGQCQFYIPA